MSQACPTSAEIDQFLRASDDQIQADSRFHAIQLHILECPNCLEQMEEAAQKALGTAFPDNAFAFFGQAATRAESVGLAPKIEGFVLGDRLGRGGMGTVFKAWQTAMRREVAIKVLPGGPLADPRWRAWCLADARAAAQVRHPDAVQVHDVGMTDGYPYLVMEYVAGGSLAHRLRTSPSMPFRDAARLLARVARVVHHMHLRGLIHRDLKPGNILIDSPSDAPPSAWWPKVADFGLARPIGESARSLTLAGIGTPEYIAPELVQGSGAKIKTFADIYALGAILYCLLVGRSAAVSGGISSGDAGPSAGREPDPATGHRQETPERPGDDCSEVSRTRPASSLCNGRSPGRRPRFIPRRPDHPRPTDGAGASVVAVCSSASGGSFVDAGAGTHQRHVAGLARTRGGGTLRGCRQ